MSYQITVEEYASLKMISDSAVRKQIRTGKIPAVLDGTNKKRKYLIVVSETEYYKVKNKEVSQPVPGHISEPELNKYEDAELVAEHEEEKQYSLVSMENTTFENLFNSIQRLADDRKQADERTIEDLKQELYKSQAELKTKDEEIKNNIETIHAEKLRAAQVESELKIKELGYLEKDKVIVELQEKITEKDLKIENLEKLIKEHKYELEALLKENKQLEDKLSKYEDQEDKIKNIEQQLNNSPWWTKKL